MPKKPESPNQQIDSAIKAMMAPIVNPKKNEAGEVIEVPADIKLRTINTAIAWEKVKYAIKENDDEFDPTKFGDEK